MTSTNFLQFHLKPFLYHPITSPSSWAIGFAWLYYEVISYEGHSFLGGLEILRILWITRGERHGSIRNLKPVSPGLSHAYICIVYSKSFWFLKL
jgi:hypothetical protein